ncbi:hypothetical protein Droror1_Dr00022549 [Drosera rotundifolia]
MNASNSSTEHEDRQSSRQKDQGAVRRSNASTASPSVSWLRLKDPRIVRVSRAFGGKDRHSKVCTVRGLRDRRVRLSVPTAIQLYDLQDRLGLSQPSKAVDWLLNAAKDEIDELPPLQIPPADFIRTSLLSLNKGMINSNSNHHDQYKHGEDSMADEMSRANPWGQDERKLAAHEKEKQAAATAMMMQDHHGTMPSGFLGNSLVPQMNYHTFHQLEPSSSFSLSQGQGSDHHNAGAGVNVAAWPSPFSLPSGSHQLFLCTPGMEQPSYNVVHPQSSVASASDHPHHFDPKQVQFLSSQSQHLASMSSNAQMYPASHSMRAPFGFNVGPRLALSQQGLGFDPLLKDSSHQFPPK